MRTLSILHLEDDLLDAELVEAQLRDHGLNVAVVRVDTQPDYEAALKQGRFDLVLADYSLPAFDGMTALHALRTGSRDVPFIFVSGALGEDVAIESLRSGATDYVLKHRLERLGAAVDRALREAEARAQQRWAEEALRQSEERFRLAARAVEGVVYDWNPLSGAIYMSEGLEALTGFRPEDVVGGAVWWAERTHPEDMAGVRQVITGALEGDATHYAVEYRLLHRDGRTVYAWDRGYIVRDAQGRATRVVGSVVDVSERRRQQAEIESLNTRLQRSMRESHHRIKNNLQVLSALVEMQAMEGGETIPMAAMRRVGQHLRTLATLHDLLTFEAEAGSDMAFVPLHAALEKLLPLLQQAAGNCQLTWEADEVFLPLEDSGAFGLLVNEMVSNAFKHGQGAVWLTLRLQSGEAVLTVEDDGPGFPDGFNPTQDANTGLDLMQSMSRWDLRGDISFMNRPEGGARIVVRFPVSHALE